MMTTQPRTDTPTSAAQGFLAESLRELPAVIVQPMGLLFGKDATESDATQAFERAINLQQTTACLFKFIMGDIWNALQGYGDKKAWVIAAHGEGQYKNIKNCGYVAKAWPLHRRIESLSWSFYEATASFDRRTQDAYVKRWWAGGLTIQMIREEKAALRHGETKAQRNSRWLKALDEIAETQGASHVETLLSNKAGGHVSPDSIIRIEYCQDSTESPDVRTFEFAKCGVYSALATYQEPVVEIETFDWTPYFEFQPGDVFYNKHCPEARREFVRHVSETYINFCWPSDRKRISGFQACDLVDCKVERRKAVTA